MTTKRTWNRTAVTLSSVVYLCLLMLAPARGGASALPGEVKGRVQNEEGASVGNARVWVLELDRATRTASDGSFEFAELAPGTYQVLVETELRAVATDIIEVTADETSELLLVVPDDPLRLNEVVSVTGRADDLLRVADSATDGVVGQAQLASRAVSRPGDVLEAVPGMVATQHSGGGKANQYFVRGFNLDHGTDFRVTLEGVPVNMPSHGHGQGYADLNFLIPELVEKVSYRKGPYFAEEGDFSAAGAARFTFFDQLDESIVRVTGGSFNYARALAAGSTRVGGGDLLGAVDFTRDDGPWDRPDNFKKVSALVRYTKRVDQGGFRIAAQGYDGDWSSTDQIPRRAVESGELSRFGFVDPSDGGSSNRYSLWGELWKAQGTSFTNVQAYVMQYDMALFSNFTYTLEDSDNGDQFEQRDDRIVAGVTAKHTWLSEWGGRSVENVVGFDLRQDWIDNGLFSSRQRLRLSTTREDSISQLGAAPFFESRIHWTPWLRTVTGIRADLYRVDVTSDLPVNSGQESAGLVSPKLSLILGPWRDTEIYANFGGGFHSNDARGATITVDPSTGAPVSAVDPLARAWGYDLGLRTQAIDNLHTSVTFFGLDLASELVFVGDGGATEASRPSRRLGVEVQNYYQLTPHIKIDLDLALTRARFNDDDPADGIPGAIGTVLATGIALDGWRQWSGAIRLRYFGARTLTEDRSIPSTGSPFVTARAAYRLPARVDVGLEIFNLFDSNANDIEYYYASRLPGEPAGVDDVHFHPLSSRSLRLFLDWRF